MLPFSTAINIIWNFEILEIHWGYNHRLITGTSATGNTEKVAVLSVRTFAGPLMIALLPIDIGKSATPIISIKKFMESVIEKPKKGFKKF